MHKEDSEPKTPDKFIVENSLLNPKAKPPKDKKPPKVSSPTPKKIKKKFIFLILKKSKKKKTKKKLSHQKIPKLNKKIIPNPRSQKNQKKQN